MKHVPKTPPTGTYRLPASESRALLPATPKNNAGSAGNSWSRALLAASFASAAIAHAAPIPMTGAGSYSENFDTLPVADTTWTNDSTLPGWYAEYETVPASYLLRAGSGGATSGSIYSFGTGTATERAFGSVGSGTPRAIAYGFLLQNTSATTLLIDSISFTGEQWRNGGNTTAHKLTCSYQTSGTAITSLTPVTPLPGGWTAVSSADFTGPIATATAGALDGNLPANQATVLSNPNIAVAAGEYIFLRWHDPNDTGNDHGLALDGLTVTWSASALPSLALTATLDTFDEGAAAPASVGTVTIPAALPADLVVALASSDTSEVTVPATVTILSGQTSANFDITAVDDFLADGSQSATISASASGYLAGQKNLTITDETDAPLAVSILPSSFPENAPPETVTGTVTLAQNTLVDLTVNLVSTDVTEATVPTTVTILAGTNSKEFEVTAVDDELVDGTRTLFIQATAAGYTNGSAQIQVTDFGDTPPAATLPVNAIAFTGYSAEGNDDLAFVALVPIAAGDVILFTDNEWNGSELGSGGGFVDNNEGVLTWTAPAEGVAQGAIVTIDGVTSSSWTASVGTVTGSNFALAAAGDSVYAIQGAVLSPTRVLAAISANTDTITGTGLTSYVLLPTGADIGAYNALRNNQAAYASYVAQVNNGPTNWVVQDTGSDDSGDSVEPDVPFSAVAFTLGTPGNTFATWIASYPAVGAFTGPNDDFDNDGLDNVLENIFGSNPAVSNVGLSTVSGTATSVTFRHDRADTPATDLTASYEWSTDLATWYPSGAGGGVTVTIGAPAVITNGSPNDLVEVTASVTSGTASTLFVRLKVTNP